MKNVADTWYVLNHNATTHTFSIIASENNTKDKREGVVTIALQNLPDLSGVFIFTGERKKSAAVPALSQAPAAAVYKKS